MGYDGCQLSAMPVRGWGCVGAFARMQEVEVVTDVHAHGAQGVFLTSTSGILVIALEGCCQLETIRGHIKCIPKGDSKCH